MKIAIIGYSGSGKSTVARFIAGKLDIPVLHLDTVYWQENWTIRPQEESCAIVAQFMESNSSWVIDGNYKGILQAERFRQADRILFFSFNRITCLCRVFRRWVKYRGTTRPDIADGCQEKLDFDFIKWVLFGGRSRSKRKSYKNMCKKHSEKVTILKNQRQVDEFTENL